MRIVAYTRVSTSEQADSYLGLDAQRHALEQAATAKGWTIVEWVEDAGISGTKRERPGLARCLAMIASGDADGVAASKLDRLSRSSIHAMTLIDQAKREGWTLVALDLGLDTSTPMGAFVATVIAGVAQLERDMIAQRTRDALAQKKLAGARLGRPIVLGAAVRARIVRERDGGRSWPSIAGGLNADGVAAARGGSWRWESVRASYRSCQLSTAA